MCHRVTHICFIVDTNCSINETTCQSMYHSWWHIYVSPAVIHKTTAKNRIDAHKIEIFWPYRSYISLWLHRPEGVFVQPYGTGLLQPCKNVIKDNLSCAAVTLWSHGFVPGGRRCLVGGVPVIRDFWCLTWGGKNQRVNGYRLTIAVFCVKIVPCNKYISSLMPPGAIVGRA